jgi:hypothetical protein
MVEYSIALLAEQLDLSAELGPFHCRSGSFDGKMVKKLEFCGIDKDG